MPGFDLYANTPSSELHSVAMMLGQAATTAEAARTADRETVGWQEYLHELEGLAIEAYTEFVERFVGPQAMQRGEHHV